MPLAPAPPHAPGGRLHFEYRDAAHGERHSIHLACAHFLSTPVGARGDYRYDHDAPGPFTPTEDGVAQTAAAIIAHWSYYYPSSWTCRLVRVYYNADGALQPLDGVPDLTGLLPSYPMAGINLDTNLAHGPTKRRFLLLGGSGHRWRLWFSQVPGGNVGASVLVTPDAGGLDWRDRRVIRYLSGTATGVCDAAGERFKPEARVGVWWARPLEAAPGGGDAPPSRDQFVADAAPADPPAAALWADSSVPAPYPLRVWDNTRGAWVPVDGSGGRDQFLGPAPPSDPQDGWVWFDSTPRETPNLALGQPESYNVAGNHAGHVNDGDPLTYRVSYDGAAGHIFDWWAVTFPAPTRVSRVRFRHGHVFSDGGWWDHSSAAPRVEGQLSLGGPWTLLAPLGSYPATTATGSAGLSDGAAFDAGFAMQTVYAVRVGGVPCNPTGTLTFASCAEVECYGPAPLPAWVYSAAAGAWLPVAGVVGATGPMGIPGPPGPAGAGSSGVDGSGLLVGDCLRFPRGASVCNDAEGTVTIATPEGLHGFDATGITLPGGARLEVVEA